MAVSVVGFDVGSLTSYIAAAKSGGIETVCNEYSDRQTPTCVAFTERNRLIGTSAKLQHVTNISNTFVNFLSLLGKAASDPAIVRERGYLPYNIQTAPNGRVAVKVTNANGTAIFTPEQLLAMHLSKLKCIAEKELSNKVVDVVINVPTYYTDAERRAVLDASKIAGLNCVKLVNDLTAIGTAYGIYNVDLPPIDSPSRNVAFISVGYVSTQVSVCAFNNGRMKVLATACDWQLGGRDFDNVIFRKFADEFQVKYNTKLSDHPKSALRLLQECEKVKKVMSANAQELPVNIECILGDKDLHCRIKRSEFDELCTELHARFANVLERCLSLAKVKVEDIHSVELVGGSSRIPALKSIVASMFKQEGRTSLNADEAVARGCALQAAICSPAYKVREFNVTETCPYAINLYWNREDGGEQGPTITTEAEGEMTVQDKDTSVEVFPVLHPIPSSRRMFFNRKGNFMLEARYADPTSLPNDNVVIGTFKIRNNLSKSGEVGKIRVKVRMNEHGVFSVSQAEVAEEYEKEVEVEVPEVTSDNGNAVEPKANAEKSMEVEAPNNGDISMEASSDTASDATAQKTNEDPAVNKKPAAKTKTIIKKKAIRYKNLEIESAVMQLDKNQLNEYCEIEGKLFEQDELEHKRAHAKNAVEEYVYEMRNKLQESLNAFATPKEQTALSEVLNEAEDWLYGDGENVNRQVYVDRLNQMKVLGDRIEMRAAEQQGRQTATKNFEQSIVHIRKVIDSALSGQEAYNHLTQDQINQLKNSLQLHENWLREQLRLQSTRPQTEDPVVKTAEIISHQKEMEAVCIPIINTPKPAPPPPPPSDVAPDAPTQKGPVPNENGVPNDKPVKSPKAPNKTANTMEVD